MHPIERLRHVARADGAPVDDILRSAAASLAGFSDDPAALVTACRRLIERHPENGPVWWLCARVLSVSDAGDEAWRCLDAWVADRTPAELGHALPDGATVAVVGSPDRFLPALGSRGDLKVVVLDVEGDGYGFVRRLDAVDVRGDSVDVARLGAAVAASDVLLVDARVVSPAGVVASPGSWPAAAVARTSGVDVWAVGGVGRVVSPATWEAMAPRLDASVAVDQVAADLIDRVVGETGLDPWSEALRRGDTPDVPELRR